jgi:hypothetical protein
MNLSTLERWYASQCNGEWEHAYGLIRLITLDGKSPLTFMTQGKMGPYWIESGLTGQITTGFNIGLKSVNLRLGAGR